MASVTPDLTEDDKAVLVELLREVIAADRFFLSPRIKTFKAILAKLDPPTPRPEQYPPPKPPSMVLAKKRPAMSRQGETGTCGPLHRGPASL